MVTGTNGKTTTSHMLARRSSPRRKAPLRNASGSNLPGVAGASGPTWPTLGAGCASARRRRPPGPVGGPLRDGRGAFARVVPAVRPDVVVVTNLFRDQLDRYGEVDTVATIWRSALAALGAGGAGARGGRP